MDEKLKAMLEALTPEQTDEINSYHESGHACLRVKCGLPTLGFERLDDGTAQVVPDPRYPPSSTYELYVSLLAIRASRYSQKLAVNNNIAAELKAFDGDTRQIGFGAQILYAKHKDSWKESQPSPEQFTIAIIGVVDTELSFAFEDASFVNFVRGVALQFVISPTIEGEEFIQLIEEQWNLSGSNWELACYNFFEQVCSQVTTDTPSNGD